MSTGSWIVTIVAGLGFVVMFGISSAGGDYKDLMNTTLENDALTREKRKDKKIKGKSLRQNYKKSLHLSDFSDWLACIKN
tara:strand:+ start:517 stop:756 length:240 start_codon:yes stop_codon:yes gene_type:complete